MKSIQSNFTNTEYREVIVKIELLIPHTGMQI